ncbi:hypothetical protein AAY473_000655 [Plecturocebus cupreus]
MEGLLVCSFILQIEGLRSTGDRSKSHTAVGSSGTWAPAPCGLQRLPSRDTPCPDRPLLSWREGRVRLGGGLWPGDGAALSPTPRTAPPLIRGCTCGIFCSYELRPLGVATQQKTHRPPGGRDLMGALLGQRLQTLIPGP